jgi:hypothetical protein
MSNRHVILVLAAKNEDLLIDAETCHERAFEQDSASKWGYSPYPASAHGTERPTSSVTPTGEGDEDYQIETPKNGKRGSTVAARGFHPT